MILSALFAFSYEGHEDNPSFWKIFDETAYFSINRPSQKRYILYTGLICLPTILSSTTEINWVRKHLFIKYPDAKPYLDSISPYLDRSLEIVLIIFNCIHTLLRYKPFMIMLYSIMCIRKHLNHLNTQLNTYCKEDCNLMALEETIELYRYTGRGDIEYAGSDRRKITSFEERVRSESQGKRHNPIDCSNSQDIDENMKMKSVLTIRNLHEFESHLTRLSLFIKQIDIDNSLAVCITIAYHFAVLFYTIILYREFTLSITHITYILYNFFGMLPPLTIFTLGTLMECEARIMMTKLEYLFLQEETHCFMYRQMSGMKFPLWSIFKLLESIEFNCDRLMQVNLRTLQNISIILGASVFVVIQYGEY